MIAPRFYGIWLLGLVTIFIVYNLTVYSSDCESPLPAMNPVALEGQVLWQENNCVACHQLYGLGGYLGPDLTNVISHNSKGPLYVKAFLNSGVKSMPQFSFSDEEKEQLVAFLTHVDQTGSFPNTNARFDKTGWVQLEYKNTGKTE